MGTDWVDDDELSREELLERFHSRPTQTTVGPKALSAKRITDAVLSMSTLVTAVWIESPNQGAPGGLGVEGGTLPQPGSLATRA
jgi:hypothetical protein